MTDVPTLLPPTSTPVERALEQVGARVAAVPQPHDTLWDPLRAPAAILPWLAWAFSVDEWRSSWSEETKRAVIASAPAVHRMKGTRAAVEAALGALNARVDLREWFETGGAPHTAIARIYATGPDGAPQLSAELLADLQAALERSKPVRAHIALIFGVLFPPPVGVAVAGLRPIEIVRVAARQDVERPRLGVACAALRPIEVVRLELAA